MTEQPEIETPDHEGFDLIAALQGVSYPEERVSVYLDDNIMYLRNKTHQEIRRAEILGNDEAKSALEAKLGELAEAASGVKFEFIVRGVPRKVHQAILKDVFLKYPEEKDLMGRTESNDERDDEYNNKLWAAHIVKIIAPSGKETVGMTEELAKEFRGQAPPSAMAAVQKAIDSLYSGAKAGYEDLVQDNDFLSDASPEA